MAQLSAFLVRLGPSNALEICGLLAACKTLATISKGGLELRARSSTREARRHDDRRDLRNHASKSARRATGARREQKAWVTGLSKKRKGRRQKKESDDDRHRSSRLGRRGHDAERARGATTFCLVAPAERRPRAPPQAPQVFVLVTGVRSEENSGSRLDCCSCLLQCRFD